MLLNYINYKFPYQESNSPSYNRRVAHYGAHQIFTIIFYKYVVPTGHEIQPHLQLKLLLYVP
jgi:hypothetical protein